MTAYTYHPDTMHILELEDQVRRLREHADQLQAELRTERNRAGELQAQNHLYAKAAADEINRATRVYVERIKDQAAYITVLERERQ